jgi:hypothetical protein
MKPVLPMVESMKAGLVLAALPPMPMQRICGILMETRLLLFALLLIESAASHDIVISINVRY